MKEGEGAAGTDLMPTMLAEASLPSDPHTEDGSSSTRLLRDDDPSPPRQAIKQRAATPHRQRTLLIINPPLSDFFASSSPSAVVKLKAIISHNFPLLMKAPTRERGCSVCEE